MPKKSQSQLQAKIQELERKLHAVEEEKEVMRQEIHHRVKNNLQIVLSILTLQLGQQTDPGVEKVLKTTQSRVNTIALIHKNLYDSSSLAEIDMHDYITQQMADMLYLYPVRTKKMKLEIKVGKVMLDVDRAIHVALLINELIVNGIWHAYVDREPGTLSLTFNELDSENLRLIIQDDGIGMPESIILSETRSIGLRMAHNFIIRLKGKLELTRNQGTCYQIDLPK